MTPSRPLCLAWLLALGLLSGCVSPSAMMRPASTIDFDAPEEGKTGWSAYRQKMALPEMARETVFEAAKAGLGEAEFQLHAASLADGYVVGEHGMTLHDWNVVGGVYFRPAAGGWDLVILVEGSKDIGFSGDVTGGSWSGSIAKGIRQYVVQAGFAVARAPTPVAPAVAGAPRERLAEPGDESWVLEYTAPSEAGQPGRVIRLGTFRGPAAPGDCEASRVDFRRKQVAGPNTGASPPACRAVR